jgi:ribosome modulation factor
MYLEERGMRVQRSGMRVPGFAKSPARERAVAYFKGRQASECQQAPSLCPYEDETLRRVWLLGWHSAAAGQGERRAASQRLAATAAQIASTTRNGHAP